MYEEETNDEMMIKKSSSGINLAKKDERVPLWLAVIVFLAGFLFGLFCINQYYEFKRDKENATDNYILHQTSDCNAKHTPK